MRTHVTLVCDRSGSMSQVKDDAQGGVNALVERLRKEAIDKASLIHFTLYDFDTEEPLRLLYSGPVASCPKYELLPRAATPLYDAVGHAITKTGEYLKSIFDPVRPEKVIFVVQTDGQENSSKDWTLEKLKESISHQSEVYKWEFMFLGAGPAAFQGAQLGFQHVTSNTGRGSYGHTYMVAAATIANAASTGGAISMPATIDTTDDA